jgi:hypothetical protein
VPFLSFGEQALHYFDRPHQSVLPEPMFGAPAWRGADLRAEKNWIYQFSDSEIDELERAASLAQATGLGLEGLDKEQFALPKLAARVAEWGEELASGRGFVLLRGLPVGRWGLELSSIAYWGLGIHLGTPGGQNPAQELLGHVVDTGAEADDPHVRRYMTSGDIRYHCDLADVVGLLCLSAAPSGGASRLVSSVSVYNELLRVRPDLVARLYEPFMLDTRNDDTEGGIEYVPVAPCRYADGKLRTFYHSDYFRSVVRHDDVPQLTRDETELLDLYEEIANREDLRLDMQFEPGDIQWLSNHAVLHARTAYADDGSVEAKRHLLRLWLSLN